MKHGFIKVACVTPDVRVADVAYNIEEINNSAKKAASLGAKIIVFPELAITAYTCSDLFYQDKLLSEAKEGLKKIIKDTSKIDALIFVGMPLEVGGKLYNVAAAINHGKLLGFTTKTYLPNYSEFYEMRQFTPGPVKCQEIKFDGKQVPFGPKHLYYTDAMESLVVSAEICEDLWSPVSPSCESAISGATIIVNLSASNEIIGKSEYRQTLVSGKSASLLCGYLYAGAGIGESTTDIVFGGENLIAENGTLLAKGERFKNGILVSEIDTKRLIAERRKNTTFVLDSDDTLCKIPFTIKSEETKITRRFDKNPFVPNNDEEMNKRCEEILTIQAMGLRKRVAHTNARTLVVGISGGLDSTLALLIAVKTMDILGRNRKDILAITMPCFGTTDRTYNNACTLVERLGATLKEVPIKEAVLRHFKDIEHSPYEYDVTYENAQARERTQVLMDIANKEGGMVIGTGDMSELALGWATYNGDHMSMYGVNASVPKTLVRYLVSYYESTSNDEALKEVLKEVLDTPVSPELLPPSDGEITQKTEDLVGPYELHDFYLYYMMRFGYEPDKILRIAKIAFEGIYDEDTIVKWLKTFYRRFYSQQFKRSCMPDGPKVGSVALSPRGDLRMPSDAIIRVLE
ncbi:MAG: NAD(+) synthase [Suipraeoptans sp.]